MQKKESKTWKTTFEISSQKSKKEKKKQKRIRKSCAAYRTQWKERKFALWNSTLTLEKEMDINDIKAIVAENFPNLKKELNSEIHEA